MSERAVYDPTRQKAGACTSCRRPIVWRFNVTSGKASPWDVPVDGAPWVSHFATCPNAQQHRKPR